MNIETVTEEVKRPVRMAFIGAVVGKRGEIIDIATRGESKSIVVTSYDGHGVPVGSAVHYRDAFEDIIIKTEGGVEVQRKISYVASGRYVELNEAIERWGLR